MKRNLLAAFRRSSRQAGVGLVELMVAMVLGAMVVIGVVQVFTANKQTFRMQDAMAVTQESGTFAIDFMARDLLRAGFPGFPVADTAFDWDNAADGGAAGNDVLAVVYEPSATNNKFCTGEDAAGASYISNRYWVNADNQLVCQGALFNGASYVLTGSPQVLVDNVESFQVLYGVDLQADRDDDEPDPMGLCPQSFSQPTAYVTATLMPAVRARVETTEPPPISCRKNMDPLEVVRSVRIALLLRTPDPAGALVPDDRGYTVLDQLASNATTGIEPGDGRLRRLFTKTVSLRNVVEAVE